MSQEIELKLTISQESIDQLFSLDILSGYTPNVLTVENTYYDSESQVLTSAGSALRIRKTKDGYLQTLKSRGQNIGGLHQRAEWEYPIESDTLNLSLLPEGVLPEGLLVDDLLPLFSTNFQRTCWMIEYNDSRIELVLDLGLVETNQGNEKISELELELKSGNLNDLFGLAMKISRQVAVMPSDISKAERGYRLCNGTNGVQVKLPDIVPQQSLESAFCALFGYEMEQLQRNWQVFWSTQQWRYLQAFLVILGNMEAEIEWFQGMMPKNQIQFAQEQIGWINSALKPILSWWPACFALSQDAEKEPQSVAISLQQSKAMKAIRTLQLLQKNPELGSRILSLTAWLHSRDWREGQSEEQGRLGEGAVTDVLDYYFDKAFNELQTDCFAGSASNALSQTPTVHRLLMLCQYFDHLYGKELGNMRVPLQALEDNLSRLSAIDVVARLKDWLNDLPFEQQASIHSWARSQTVLLRDIKQLANKLIRGRDSISGGIV